MPLTTAQLQALKADIAADPALADLPRNSDNAFLIADAYNLIASPAFTVWRTSVSIAEIMSNGFRWTDVDGLTAGKARIWDWMTRLGTINPSKPNIQQGIVDCWGARASSQQTQGIEAHCKRAATRAEKLFATGTGSTANPGTLTFEGALRYSDVEQAWNS
jgi:hypothetical protein